MDPNACWERWKDAVRDSDVLEATYAWEDLHRWLTRGGFEPSWDDMERAEFVAWRPE